MTSIDIEGDLYIPSANVFQINLSRAQINGHVNMKSLHGAIFLNLDWTTIHGSLIATGAGFYSLDLSHAEVDGLLDLRNARVEKSVNMTSADIEDDLNIYDAKIDGTLTMISASIKGDLEVSKSDTNELLMDTSIIGRSMFMGDSVFVTISLRRVIIEDRLNLSSVNVTGKLDMNSITVKGRLFIGNEAKFSDIVGSDAAVCGWLRVYGSKVTGTLMMDSITIGNELSTSGSEFAEINLLGAQVGSRLNLDEAKVTGNLKMDSITVDGHLYMRDGAEFADIILSAAVIHGDLQLVDSMVNGRLLMPSIIANKNLDMAHSQFADSVFLPGAQIGGFLSFYRAKVTGELDMDSITVNGHVFMREEVEFAGINLSAAVIHGSLQLTDSMVNNPLNMRSISIRRELRLARSQFAENVILRDAQVDGWVDLSRVKVTEEMSLASATIKGDVYMQKAQCEQRVSLVFADIGGNFDLREATLSDDLDLGGARIGGELRLGRPGALPKWSENARLTLRNVNTDALQDEPGAWPEHIELDGFAYQRLGGYKAAPGSPADRGSEWYVDWLAKDAPFSPQPYEQLAGVLRLMGHGEEANDVLFAGRQRARGLAWADGHYDSWLFQSLLCWLIGYGYGSGFFYSFGWVLGLVVIGWVVLECTYEAVRPGGTRIGFWYSLDMLLPIVTLRQWHNDQDLDGFAGIYFYIHKLMGYVLAFFLIAGLSGLTG